VLAASRYQLVGWVLLAALLLGGCGDSGSDSTSAATVTSGATTTAARESGQEQGKSARSKQAQPGPAGPCQSQLGGFVASMDSLRGRLAVGLTYDQYVAEVRGIRSTYRKIPIERVELDCLNSVGTPAEETFNGYIEAANDWGECVSEVGCSSATVEPVLQRRWRIASHFLSAADEGLDATAP
jgi:hypothetical protein